MTDIKKRSKIIATFGPSCSSIDMLTQMADSGLDIIRLNASHFSNLKELREASALVDEFMTLYPRPIGRFLDLQGPKIRLGKISNNIAEIKTGDSFTLIGDKNLIGNDKFAGINTPSIIDDIKVNDTIFINDGSIRLIVTAKEENKVICKILQGGTISNFKGVNLPNTKISISILSEKDRLFLKHIDEFNVDAIALSFVSSASDIHLIRKELEDCSDRNLPIIAKIERESAVKDIIAIINAADIIMVARGDLGVEVGIEKVPQIQKQIVREGIRHIKPIIVATQMLESMIHNLSATRAEVSDVANAIYDHCDMVMLSGETAVGINPANAVKTMSDICVETDQQLSEMKQLKYATSKHIFATKTQVSSFCRAADQIAEANDAKAILTFTSSGNTPLIASKLNPSIPIIAAADSIHILRRLSFYRGVIPILIPEPFTEIQGWGKMIEMAVEITLQKNLLKKGDKVVVTAGIPIGISGGTNSIRMITIE